MRGSPSAIGYRVGMSEGLTTVLWITGLVLFVVLLARTKTGANRSPAGADGDPSQAFAGDTDIDRRIGLVVGAMGGSMRDAVEARYSLSRVVAPGERPTDDQIARAVGLAMQIEPIASNR
jgi:hypothetical protein